MADGLLGKKPRPMEDLLRDGAFPFMVGRLVGAAAMTGYWLTLKEDPEIKAMGERVNDMVAWFYEQGEEIHRGKHN